MSKNKNTKNIERIPYDGILKNFLKEPILLRDYLIFAGRRDIVDIINFEEEIIPIDTDVNNIFVITESKNKRYADVVLKVQTIDANGIKGELMLHFEPQSFDDKTYPYRMYTYHRRIEVIYEIETVSFALCFKKYPTTIPNQYVKTSFGSQTEVFTYNQVHLRDDDKYKAKDFMETENLAEIALCGLMNRRGVKKFDLYLSCLKNLDTINKKGLIKERKDNVFKIVLTCLYHFIKLEKKEERDKIKEEIKRITQGDEDVMEMMTLLHEESKIQGKIDTFIKIVKRDLGQMENDEKEELIEHLQVHLESLDDTEDVDKIEDEILACTTPVEIAEKIKTLKLEVEMI